MDSMAYYSDDDDDFAEFDEVEGLLQRVTIQDSSASHANSLLPISRLPGDALVLIFQYSSTIRRSHGNIDEVHVVRKEIVSITHVCHEWRSIALDYSGFWSCIDFCSLEWANEMVLRARDAPLCIQLDLVVPIIRAESQPKVNKRSVEYFCSRVLPSLYHGILDISRIHKMFIEVTDPTGQLTGMLLGFFGKPNAIRRLYIHQVQQHIEHMPLPIIPNLIPRRFFHAPTPNLQHLDLGHCAVSWRVVDAKSFAELRTLALDRGSYPQRMEDFCRVLSKMAKLEELRLNLVSSTGVMHVQELEEESYVDPRPVMLPNLKVYHITAYVEEAIAVVEHVLYPAHACVRLLLFGEPHPSILNHRSLMEKLSVKNPSSLLIENNSLCHRHSISIWDSPTSHPAHHASSQPHTGIVFAGGVDLPNPPLHVVLKTLAIPDLRKLTINHLGPLKEEPWHDFFSRHTDISHLEILSRNIQPFTSLLSSLDHATTTQPGLPKLQTLSLNSEGCASDELSKLHGLDSYEDFDALLRCLTGRFHCGVPVETLIMPLGGGYGLTPEDIEELRRVGTSVVHPFEA